MGSRFRGPSFFHPESAMKSIEEKLARYREFWDDRAVPRPIIGFDVGGWFPFRRFSALKRIEDRGIIGPGMIDPRSCGEDYRAFMEASSKVEDDYVKGVCPISAIPWMEAMLGCRLVRNGESVWAEERKSSLEELADIGIDDSNPWFGTYLSFVRVLTEQAEGRYPVGLPILRGVTDLIGVLRGASDALIDNIENPEKIRGLARRCAEATIKVTKAHHAVTGSFMGGFFIEQYSLWAPGPLVRMQEDATAVYSPRLYADNILDADRMIARSFPYSLLHLHVSSLFLLKEFLSIGEIGVFQINRDVGEMGLPEMLPYLKTIQEAGRRIYLRGPLTADDFRFIERNLSPDGLMIQSVLGTPEEAENLADRVRRLWRK